MVNLLELEEKRKRQMEESERIRNADPLGIKKQGPFEVRIMKRIIAGEKARGLSGSQSGESLLHALLGVFITDIHGAPNVYKALEGLYECCSNSKDKDIPVIHENALIRYCEYMKDYQMAEDVLNLLFAQLHNEKIGYSPYRIDAGRVLIEYRKKLIEIKDTIGLVVDFDEWFNEKNALLSRCYLPQMDPIE